MTSPEETATHPLPLSDEQKCGVAIFGGVTVDNLQEVVGRTREVFSEIELGDGEQRRDCLALAVNMLPLPEYAIDLAFIATAIKVNGEKHTHTVSKKVHEEAVLGDPRPIWTGENDNSNLQILKVVTQAALDDGTFEDAIVYSLLTTDKQQNGQRGRT